MIRGLYPFAGRHRSSIRSGGGKASSYRGVSIGEILSIWIGLNSRMLQSRFFLSQVLNFQMNMQHTANYGYMETISIVESFVWPK